MEGEAAELTFAQRLQRGDTHLEAGRLAEAIWDYAAAHQLDPEAPEPRVRLGYVHLRADPERSRPLFESALERAPNYASAHTGLGLALMAAGEKGAGRRHLERGVELAPKSAEAQAALGVALDQLGRSEAGIAHLKEAHLLAPHDSRIMNNLGVAHLRSGHPELAEPLFRAALRQDARDEKLRANNLGMALALQGEFAEALEWFRKGGDEQAARNNLGYAFFARGEYERAIAEFERALVAGGDANVEVVRNLKAARRALREGLAPDYPPAVSRSSRVAAENRAPEAEAETVAESFEGETSADEPSATPVAGTASEDTEGDGPSLLGDPWLSAPAPPGAADPSVVQPLDGGGRS